MKYSIVYDKPQRIRFRCGAYAFDKAYEGCIYNFLIEKNYVEHHRYGSISLTKKGEEFGRAYAKKMDILREFLINVIGVNKEKAHYQAQNMMLCLDDETVNKIHDFIKTL